MNGKIDKHCNLLLIEDNPDEALFIQQTLTMSPFTTFDVHWEHDTVGGKLFLDKNKVDIVLLDLSLPDISGTDNLLILKNHTLEIPVVVLIGHEGEQRGEKAVWEGAQDYINKNDISPQMLDNSIRYAIERQRLLTQLKKKRSELIKSEEQQKKIIEKTVDGLLVVNKKGRVRFMNKAAETLLGRTSKELVGEQFGFNILSQPPIELTIPGKCKGKRKEISFADMQSVEIQWEGEEAWLVSLRDITRRKQMEQALLVEKERLEVILRSVTAGVIATNQEGMVVLINRVVEQLTGCSQEKACNQAVNSILNIKNKTDRDRLADTLSQVLKTGRSIESMGETTLTTVDGIIKTIEYSCAPILTKEKEVIGAVLVIHDVTDTRKMEAEVEKAQKLESLEVLAGGLAYEYNDVLTSLLDELSMGKTAVDEGSRVFDILTEAEEGALRLKELNQRLLNFSRGGPLRKTPTYMPALLRQITSYMPKDIPVKFRWKIPGDCWTVLLDKDQLNLAIRNILQNAIEALPTGGIVTIEVENITISSNPLLPIKPGNYVKVSITDQGKGISEEHLQKIFDPYFTTKKDNPGMGLTIAYSIVKKHGGAVDVISRVGKGSTFSLYLPAHEHSICLRKY